MSGELLLFPGALIGAGLFAGLIGGLFGVGGGVVMVPALYVLFGALGVPDDVRMHLSVGTSLSTIIATSARSLAAHHKAGAVDVSVLRAWTPWIACGAIVGSSLGGLSDAEVLLFVFGAGLLLAALQMGFANPNWRLADDLPRGATCAGMGVGIGAASAMMGIGGGSFGVPLMTLCGRSIHQAVATASGFGAAIALPAALGFIITGWGRDHLPWGSLGFINMPGFVLLASLTALTAPIGARLAHRLDQKMLKRAFAIFMAFTALNMLREAFIR